MEDEKEQLQKRIDRMQKKVSPKLIVCYQVNMSFLVIIASSSTHESRRISSEECTYN